MMDFDFDDDDFVFTCMRCGDDLPEDSDFCRTCGHLNTDSIGYYERTVLLENEVDAMSSRIGAMERRLKESKEKNTVIQEMLEQQDEEIALLLQRIDNFETEDHH